MQTKSDPSPLPPANPHATSPTNGEATLGERKVVHQLTVTSKTTPDSLYKYKVNTDGVSKTVNIDPTRLIEITPNASCEITFTDLPQDVLIKLPPFSPPTQYKNFNTAHGNFMMHGNLPQRKLHDPLFDSVITHIAEYITSCHLPEGTSPQYYYVSFTPENTFIAFDPARLPVIKTPS